MQQKREIFGIDGRLFSRLRSSSQDFSKGRRLLLILLESKNSRNIMHQAKDIHLASFIRSLLLLAEETLGACSWRAQFIRQGKMCVVPGLLLGDDTFVTYQVAFWMWQKNNWVVVGACLEPNSLMSGERARKMNERQKRSVGRWSTLRFIFPYSLGRRRITDSCSSLFCGRGRECQMNAQGHPECVCVKKCRRHHKLICGNFHVLFFFFFFSFMSFIKRKEKTGNKYFFNFSFTDP